MTQDTNHGPTVTELYAAYQAAERVCNDAKTQDETDKAFHQYMKAFIEMCATPSTSYADMLAKQEAFLKMELDGGIAAEATFEDAIVGPLSELTFVMAAAVSVYRDLQRLADA